MIYVIYSYGREEGIVIRHLNVDFNKAKVEFISTAPDWTHVDGGDNGLNFIAIDSDKKSTFNLLNNLYKKEPKNYAWDKDIQDFLSRLFEHPSETYVDNFMADDVISWLDTEKGIDGFDALDLPDDEWDEYAREYVNTII